MIIYTIKSFTQIAFDSALRVIQLSPLRVIGGKRSSDGFRDKKVTTTISFFDGIRSFYFKGKLRGT